MAQYANALTSCPAPRVLTVYDAQIVGWHNAHGTSSRLLHLLSVVDMWAWRRYRRARSGHLGAIVVFTESDRCVLKGLGITTRLVQIPLAVPVPEQTCASVEAVPAELLFVGNFMHPPNIDAARRLITSIFPAVRDRCQNVRLMIVGPNPPPDFNVPHAQVVVTGYVPDVQPYLERASIVVIPIRLGGGMRMKTLEAFAAGKAIVASRIAVAGLPIVDGEQVVLADQEEEFAAAVLDLLEDQDRRARLGSSAQRWAQQHISWQHSVTAFERLYAELRDEAGENVEHVAHRQI